MPSGEPFFSLRARDYLGYPGLNGMAGFAARTTAQVFKIGDLVRVPDRSGSVTIGASFHLDFGAGSLKSCLHSDHRLLPRDIESGIFLAVTRNIIVLSYGSATAVSTYISSKLQYISRGSKDDRAAVRNS
jgi:hypothetical protein